ncbi:hypothetical protein [Microbacterium xanthum]|uniref:hypothetical protein n=1 Tax=Microbacterium xanthum TaxID=3079794 RepID=UPI002AD3F24B|nr:MULTISPECIES: hypothetical protein [unclassified Microbacterium]MDZ8172558.1 hypothetical protein [Microbacterium sp. KSW-48]MDZ8202605.1 hypothetical protein [Microbacterium sp. SSW1-59]
MARESAPLAWVESPLQLIGAAEWAHARRESVVLAGRLTAQMPETADELLARGARFAETHPYLGIPWGLLARHRHWLVGDGYSGQFRLAAAVLRPRRVTFLDDGANAVAYADTLVGRRPYARPGHAERGLTTRVGPIAHAHLISRALEGEIDVFTAFDLGYGRRDALAELGVPVTRHDFAFTRETARPHPLPTSRVVLGSARPEDGHLDRDVYLDWVAHEASIAPVTYLPHRRESAQQLEAVARLPHVMIERPNLPIELVLAGARERLDVLTLTSSTTTTLPLVLNGSAAVLRAREPGTRHRRRAVR